MKKYKLIKKYPDSPELGTIDTRHINFGHQYISNPEDYPEFWEEIVKKDYEILSYKNFITGAVNTIGQRFLSNEGYREFTERDLDVVNEPTGRKVYFINSVKRLSDGEVFTVGDNTSLGIIKSIELTLNAKISGIKLDFKNNHNVSDLCFKEFLVQKVKQPLFETKEVVEKDYEILSYISKLKNCIIEPKNPLFNNGVWDIHSIKRLSDGEVFTVGDIINTKVDNKYKQEIIEISLGINNTFFKDRLIFKTKTGHVVIDIAVKSKKPLFTTEDGVDVYEGDEVTWVFNDNSGIAGTRKAEAEMYRNLKYFSTKEKAEEYVLMNESKYSINDILASLPNRKCEKYTSIKQIIENLKNM